MLGLVALQVECPPGSWAIRTQGAWNLRESISNPWSASVNSVMLDKPLLSQGAMVKPTVGPHCD